MNHSPTVAEGWNWAVPSLHLSIIRPILTGFLASRRGPRRDLDFILHYASRRPAASFSHVPAVLSVFAAISEKLVISDRNLRGVFAQRLNEFCVWPR